jgi:hypothetical protein
MSYIWLQFYVSFESGPNFSRDSFSKAVRSAPRAPREIAIVIARCYV